MLGPAVTPAPAKIYISTVNDLRYVHRTTGNRYAHEIFGVALNRACQAASCASGCMTGVVQAVKALEVTSYLGAVYLVIWSISGKACAVQLSWPNFAGG